MGCKYITRFVLLLLFAHILESAPVYKFDFFTSLQSRNCTFPASIYVPDETIDENFYRSHLDSCSNVSQMDPGEAEVILCQEVDRLFSGILCNKEIDEKKANVTVAYPKDENVCNGFRKLNTTLISESGRANLFCEMICHNNKEVCQFLLWVYQINSALEGKISLDHEDYDIPLNIHDAKNLTSVPPISASTRSPKVHATSFSKKHTSATVHIHTGEHTINVRPHMTKIASSTVAQTYAAVSFSISETGIAMHSTSGVISDDGKQTEIPMKKSEEGTTPATEYSDKDFQNSTAEVSSKKASPNNYTVAPEAKSSIQSNEMISSSVKAELGDMLDSKGLDSLVDDDLQDTSISSKADDTVSQKKLDEDDAQSKMGDGTRGSSKPGFFDPRGNFDKSMPVAYVQSDDPHFYLYFLFIVGIVIGCYVLFHNKQKIIALIVEGRHERRRRPNGASYKKLETK